MDRPMLNILCGSAKNFKVKSPVLVFLWVARIVLSFIQQIFIEHLLWVRQCFGHWRYISEQNRSLCSHGAYIQMGEEREKKTKTKTKQQQNATEMNIRGNWVKCIRALSVPFLLFFCKSKIKTQKTNKQNIYLIMSAMKKCQSGKEIGN